MREHNRVCRRSFLAIVTGGMAGMLGVSSSASGSARSRRLGPGARAGAPIQSQRSAAIYDSDKGSSSDNGNMGGARGARLRSRVYQCSDQDSGSAADPLGESQTRRTYSYDDGRPGNGRRTCPRPWYRS